MGILDPVETLRRVPFFAGLRPQELENLATYCVVRHLAKDEMLFAEGDPCEGLFVVQSGVLKLLKMSETGREQVLATERAGSTVGELALFDGGVLFLPRRPPWNRPPCFACQSASSSKCARTVPKWRLLSFARSRLGIAI